MDNIYPIEIEPKLKKFFTERLKNLEKNSIEQLKEIEKLKYECFFANNINIKDNESKKIKIKKIKNKF